MKMKNTIMMLVSVLTVMAFWSCSSNEDIMSPSVGTTDDAILFAASTDYTRGGDYTTNNLTTFNVYAYTQSSGSTDMKLFMDNVTVTKTGNNVWTYSPVEYWPASGTVNFYAFAPAEWIGTSTPLNAISYDSYPGYTDVIYAVSGPLQGNSDMANAQVLMNFRHALAKVTAKLSSTNPELRVQVSNVIIYNVATRANFHFPSGSTSDTASKDNIGIWSDQNTPLMYILYMAQQKNEVINLTTTPTDLSDFGNGMGGDRYMMPQELVWLNDGDLDDMYIGVMCSIYDVSTGEKLWPNANTPAEDVVPSSTFGDGILKFPLSTSKIRDWQPGVHYTYNLIINSNDDMGQIEFGTPTVDTFLDVTAIYQ